MNHNLVTLKNGLRVILVPMPGVRSLTIMKGYNVGSRHETDELAGGAHFAEHMMFKGAKKYTTAQSLSEALDGIGAEYNASTAKDITKYYIRTPASKLEFATEALSDMLYDASFEAEELEREKGVIIEEMKLYEDSPSNVASEAAEALVFKGSKLALPIIGTRDTINQMTRERLFEFKQKYYDDANSALIVAGAIPDNIEVVLNKFFNRPICKEYGTQFERAVLTQDRPWEHYITKDVEQAHFVLAFPGEGSLSPKREAYGLVSTILGGGMSSRLFNEVRERRGLCYSIGMGGDTHAEVGTSMVYAGVNEDRAEEALTATIGELKKVKSGSITAEELQKAKDYITGHVELRLESTGAVASWFCDRYTILGEIITPEEKIERIQAVTLDTANSVANELLDFSKVSLAMVSREKPNFNIEKLLETLQA